MEFVLLIARLFLAVVFGVAGVAKASDPEGSRRAIIGFGASERLAAVLKWGLPAAEILVALALLPVASAWWGAVAALALILIFTTVVGVSLVRGLSPDCRCFGQLHSRPVSWVTLMRNLLLAVIAGGIVVWGKDHPGLSVFNWMTDLSTAEIVNFILTLCMAGLLTAGFRLLKRIVNQQASLLERIEAVKNALDEELDPMPAERKEAAAPQEGLPIGVMAPKFSLSTVSGDEVSLEDLLGKDNYLLLIFVGPNCWGCKMLLPAVRVWQREYADRLTIAVLSNGSLEDNRAKMVKYEIDQILLDGDSKVADDFQATWTPAAVLISPHGKIASQVTYGDTAIREWLRNLVASGKVQSGAIDKNIANGYLPQVSIRYSVRGIGETVPSFSLPDLSDKIVRIEDLFGRPTLLLFWHPHCEYCRAMFDDLKRWEDNAPEGAPKLVFIATGEVEDIRSVNKSFKSLTLLDPPFDIGPLFGTKVTPSAILIDEQGRIMSSLAMGDQNVRALVGLLKAEQQAIA